MTRGTAERSRACRCGVRYDARGLEALPAVQVLGPSELDALTVGWPSDVVVVVRACAACHAPIAALAPCAGPRVPTTD